VLRFARIDGLLVARRYAARLVMLPGTGGLPIERPVDSKESMYLMWSPEVSSQFAAHLAD
jgi:hypothetical protein